ncbi:hypothetical protein [Paenibacillus sp. OK060]|uniref:hypothetical protein n=1 Tax=Paenibacillus sp. OK060 TaxID=1881034 RepID=UPI00115FD1E8|nr:hypothetical protein [Paenibacillus sp. OK060]
MSEYQRPARIFVVADGDSRIPFLEEVAKQYMPGVKVRFTTDERLISGLGKETFLNWEEENQMLKAQTISFMQPDAAGNDSFRLFIITDADAG